MASLKVYDVLHQPFIAILVMMVMGWVPMPGYVYDLRSYLALCVSLQDCV